VFLSGCHKRVKLVFGVAANQVQAIPYATAGQTITWLPYNDPGQPAKPVEPVGHLPCDKMETNAKTLEVTCHLKKKQTGTYRFYVAPKTGKNLSGAGTGPFVMHVGPCQGCTKVPAPGGKPQISPPDTVPANVVALFCDASNNNQADPSNLPVSVGDTVYWSFQAGDDPPQGKDPFDVTLKPGACSNYPSGTIIKTEHDYCTVDKSMAGKTIDYDFTVSGCNASPTPNATITVH
jgi:plastocyanin